jgi:hypothetical protein
MIIAAHDRLERLEEKVNPPRLYDATTGEATTPTAKRAGTKVGPTRRFEPARQTPPRQDFDAMAEGQRLGLHMRGEKQVSKPSPKEQHTESDKRFSPNRAKNNDMTSFDEELQEDSPETQVVDLMLERGAIPDGDDAFSHAVAGELSRDKSLSEAVRAAAANLYSDITERMVKAHTELSRAEAAASMRKDIRAAAKAGLPLDEYRVQRDRAQLEETWAQAKDFVAKSQAKYEADRVANRREAMREASKRGTSVFDVERKRELRSLETALEGDIGTFERGPSEKDMADLALLDKHGDAIEFHEDGTHTLRPNRAKNNDMEEYLEVNGSGDSSASLEAINRDRDEREAGQVRRLIDRDGSVHELRGVDSVDTHARPGQIIVQRGIGREEWTVLSHGNDISPDLVRGRINAARFHGKLSTQNRKTSGIGISKQLKNEIYAEIKRITGLKNTAKEQHLFFVKAKEIGGASGQYTPAQRAIKVAISSVDPMGVAYHEALHDFIAGLQDSHEGRELRKSLFKAGEMPHIRAQLKELLKDHPKALAAIETDAEERIAYLFQFWAVGKYTGKELIKVRDPATKNALGRLAEWIRQLLGVLSQDAKAERVLEALYDGRFADRNTVAAVIQDMGLMTIEDKTRRVAGPLADVYDKLMLVATDRLRNFGVEPLDELADMFATEPGREKDGLRFLQRRAQVSAKYLNRVGKLFHEATAEQRATALRNLQAMQDPSSPLEKEVRSLLDDLHAYMDEAGVRRLEQRIVNGKEDFRWVKLPKVAKYFPRRWDAGKVLKNEAKFKALLAKHGKVNLEQQNAIVQALVHGDGQIDLADSEYHVGYTPFARHVQDRQLTFIDESNAAEFAEFQNSDLADILTGYIFQAVHRGEFARDFGNAGEEIQSRLQEAAKHLDGKQVAEAGNTIKGLVGTLGADVNPRLKDIMSAAITAENVILLPLTMFSQFIDALGVGLRAQAPVEAWNAFKRGMQDFARAVKNRTVENDDYDTEMAKTLGLIDEQNMLEAMGQAHAGAFMSKFARDVNRKFFRWNGMESWNRSMRISAMVAGERFIQRELDNERYMRELGLEKSDVMVKPDGRLAVTAEQMIALGATKKQAEARELRVQQALFRFVDGAVLRPNAVCFQFHLHLH